ncbi:MBL fold metallo-hydrolase [Salinisphaera sp. Q1T1-3]|uniref:MBL fold metallo-hydrolase n=1 Tax=Salinisphaera sp. Q1T1-3 TaxID=2321229 RepID=UPI000E7222F7|nr:MBL fold metallo-hydrolase [Salinisphaera sp. Q1T1-3]RJS92410.1 hypothetical protein D3260_12275 [Salinisphaera sp. Q1T1-3]
MLSRGRGDLPEHPHDHFDGERFFNPGLARPTRSRRAFWHWLLVERRQLAPWTIPARRPGARPPMRVRRTQVTWIGHATALIQTDGCNLLTDPVYARTVNPIPGLGPARVHPPGIAWADLPPIDIVVISHAHYDHLDSATVRRLVDTHDPLFVAGLGLHGWLARRGARRIVTLDWWQGHDVPGNATHTPIRLTAVPAQHWSRRSLGDRNRVLWAGYMIETDTTRLYFAGDTGFRAELFRDIAAHTGQPDLALLPIGAYEPRRFMARQHMNPDEAVQAHELLGARRSMAIHFGTFRLTDEDRAQPAIDLVAALQQHEVPDSQFVVPDFGQTVTPSEDYETTDQSAV